MNERLVLTQEEAFELLAFLVTSARGLLDEPRAYGPRRLLRATQKLAGFLLPRADEEARPFLGDLQQLIDRLFPLPENDEQLGITLDACCEMAARELVRQACRQDYVKEGESWTSGT